MADHTFEELDSKKFEQLANALGAEYIARGLRIFGSGTDGGREATYEGKMKYPDGEPWDGYLVVQCKQKEERGKSPKEEADWAIAQLDAEMSKYKTAKKERRRPEYFLFVTNARLSAQLDTGGKDRFVTRLKHWASELNIKGADVWDRDKLNNLLDVTPKIVQRFGLVTGGDMIGHIARTVFAQQEGIETTLSLFLQEELRADQFVNLAQAGHSNDERTSLARVFVDLRATSQERPRKSFLVVDTIQEASDRAINPALMEQEADESRRRAASLGDSLVSNSQREITFQDSAKRIAAQREGTALFAARQPKWLDPTRFVIVGGPGQGKSTLAQQLAQRHRAALLKARAPRTLEQETKRILRTVEDATNESGIGLPKHPRWPFRVVLEQFADALAKGKVESVLEYIASQIQRRTKRHFEARDAEELLSTTAWFVAFDGLDEVPAVSNRSEVLDAVRRFLLEARDKDADLLVIATTRPQGYEDDFAQSNFNHINLRTLSRDEALNYARKFVEAKYEGDIDRQERIIERLDAAARDESIARLMQTPLQVTIMAALVDLVGNPPRERYLLFQRYYEIIYQREQERGLTLSDVLARYRAGIEILHDRIGLLLQLEAESKGKAESQLSQERLERLVRDYLITEEFTGEALERTKANFMAVALSRLVFIVPLQDERYGFEVRSLQEFSAARALMRGSYVSVKERLRAIAPVPYWRNTMLFAIGRAFAEQDEPQCDMVMQLCNELNDNEQQTVLTRTLAGSRLALDILEDGIVAWRPRYRRQFMEAALQLLRLPHEGTALRLAGCYTEVDEQRYEKAVQITVASSGTVVPIGLFIMLGALAGRDDENPWAQELLVRHWPKSLKDETLLLEQMRSLLPKSEWADAVITRVAGANDLDWLDTYLGSPNDPQWIQDIHELRRSKKKKVFLAGDQKLISYDVNFAHIQEDVLDRIVEARPIHYEWLPFTLGRKFMANPSPESLADTLETLVDTNNWKPGRGYSGLPWQLASLLSDTESSEELLRHAQRARKGELGTSQDWLTAERRWTNRPFTIIDLTAFTDVEWPYKAKIADHGIIPSGAFTVSHEIDKGNFAALCLLDAVNAMPSSQYRPYVIMALLFLLTSKDNNSNPLILSLDTILDLVEGTTWHVQAIGLVKILDPGLDWVEEVKTLNIIGERISILGYEEDSSLLEENKTEDIVGQLMPLLVKKDKSVREGLLRFAAALATVQVDVPVPAIELESLTPEGRVAIVTLNLLAKKALMDTDTLTQQVIQLWSHLHPQTGIAEILLVLGRLLDRPRLPEHAIDLFDNLYDSPVGGDHATRVGIIGSFMSQLQYRTSGLDNPARKKQFATGWLIEALNQ
jgi:hypothetical protein